VRPNGWGKKKTLTIRKRVVGVEKFSSFTSTPEVRATDAGKWAVWGDKVKHFQENQKKGKKKGTGLQGRK